MAQPKQPPQNQPLLDLLAVNGVTLAEMNQMLTDGAQEAEMLIPKLIEKHTTGADIKAAQVALVLRELKAMQSALWGDLGAVTRKGVAAAYLRGHEAPEDLLLRVLGKAGVNADWWRDSWQLTAQQGIAAVLSKAKNGIPLSRAVYQTQALATNLVNKRVQTGLLLGMNAKAIAKSVKDLILPGVRGGVSYAAHRLARTEINNAYKTSQEARYATEPWVTGMRWNLSGSHPKPDICNVNAEQDVHGLGAGVYRVGQRPDSHPNCLCYLTAEQIDEDDFVDAFVRGDYNTYLDEQVYGTKVGGLPCP